MKLAFCHRNIEDNRLFCENIAVSPLINATKSFLYRPAIFEEILLFQPDVIVIDITIPTDIIKFVRESGNKYPSAKIIITFDFFQPDLVLNCILAGAHGYVEKTCTVSRFNQALEDSIGGMAFFPLSILKLLYSRFIEMERDVLKLRMFQLLSTGFRLQEVVQRTGMEESDIKKQLFLSVFNTR